MVDAVGRDWLTKTFPDPAPLVSNGLGMQVADKLAGFYADDGLLSATDAVWLQFALEQLVAIFRRVGLKANATKTQAMICYPTAIPTAYSEAAYLRRTTGVGPTSKERRREKIQCPSCDTSLARASLRQHLQSVHGEELLPSTLHLTQPVGPPQLYTTSIPITDPVSCPVPNCPHRITGRATQTTRSYNMRKHFMYRHPQHSLCLRNEGSEPLLRCDRCDMHVGALALNTGHYRTKLCLHGAARKARRALAANVQDARTRTFHIGTTDLEKVEVFRYLGRMMAAGNSDWPAVYKNLRKARSKWGQISKPLIGTGVPPRTIGYFYKAIVQAVLLYGCETWVVTPAMLRALSGFHNRMARRIANRMPRLLSNGEWHYPCVAQAREIAGLHTIEEYIRRRQATLVEQIALRPVHRLCQQATPLRLQADPTPPQFDADLPQQEDPPSDSTTNTNTTSTPGRRHSRYYWWTQPLRTEAAPILPPLPEEPHQPLPPAAPIQPPPPVPPVPPAAHDIIPAQPPLPPHPAAAAAPATGVFHPLTLQEAAEVSRQSTLNGRHPDTVIQRLGRDRLHLRSLRRLQPGTWLNDEVLSFTTKLLLLRDQMEHTDTPTHRPSYAMPTHFLTAYTNQGHADPTLCGRPDYRRVRNWSHRAPANTIFELSQLFFPIHTGGNHWLLIVAHMQDRVLQ